MNEKVLFEIPIYAMRENVFNHRWQIIKTESIEYSMAMGNTEEDARHIFHVLNSPKDIWKYNQIIGYIVISVTHQDVNFKLYCSMDKRYYANSSTKHFIKYLPTTGIHFYALRMDDSEIKEEIRKYLKSIERHHLRKSYFVDYSTFNNLFDAVDIKQIMDAMEN